MSAYVGNLWYMAGWSHELDGDVLLARRLLDQPWLLWRTGDGAPVMMADRCPHRFIPLSRGTRVGDTVHCAYHGLGFAADGICVHSPFGGTPPDAQVPTLPVVERHGVLWFWPGAAEPDPGLIPDFAFLDDPAPVHRGHMVMDANYELIADNLLDLSHAEFIHRDSFGVNGSLLACGQQSVTRDADGAVWNRWDITDAEPPAWAAPLLPEGARIDQQLHIRWHAPAALALHIGMAIAGSGFTEPVVPAMLNPHILTPETQATTHYFYTHEPTEEAAALTWQVFMDEDEPMVRAQQEALSGDDGVPDFWGARPLILPTDAAAIRARRHLMQLRRDEAAGAG